MPLSIMERTFLLINCPTCLQANEKPVSWLISKNDMPCHCGARIDLMTPDNTILIQKTADNCSAIAAALDQLGHFVKR